MTTTAPPGLAGPSRGLTMLHWVGVALLVVGVLLVLVGIADLRGVFDRTMDVVDAPGQPGEVAVDDGPGLFWAFILGLPLLLAGGAALLLAHPGSVPARTVTVVFCRECGTRHEGDVLFCESCGASLA